MVGIESLRLARVEVLVPVDAVRLLGGNAVQDDHIVNNLIALGRKYDLMSNTSF